MRYGVSGFGGGDYFTSHLKFNKTSESNQWKSFGMDMLGSAMDIGMLLGMGALTGAMGPSKKGTVKQANANKAQTANDLSQATAQFKNKYPGAQFSADGKVTSTFESLQKPLNDRLSTLNKQLVDAQGKEKAEVTQLKAARAEYQSLSDDSKVCKQNEEAINNIKNKASGESYEGVNVASVIDFSSKPAKVDESKLKNSFPTNYANANKPTDKEKAQENANKLKRDGLKSKAQSHVDAYNNMRSQTDNIYTSHGVDSLSKLEQKESTAKESLEGLQNSDTGKQINTTLDEIEATQARLDKLGTKADFDAAAKNINGLVDQLASDTAVGDANQKAKDAKKAYKDAKKAGLKGHDLDLLRQQKKDTRNISNNLINQYRASMMGDG